MRDPMNRIARTTFLALALAAAAALAALPACAGPRAKPGADAEGFVVLFNGKNLEGWRGLIELPTRMKMTPEERAKAQAAADESMRAHWRVEDGILVYDGKGQSLVSGRDYQDFELWVDWKIEPKGDSGIYLRGTPQVQIWDNPEGSGGLWNNKHNPNKPLVVADNPVGEWNSFRIRMIGERVTVWLNGKLVVENTVLENYWEPGKPVYATGPFELQNHGDKLYFRNIKIREIPRS
jgi:hypothetical protein